MTSSHGATAQSGQNENVPRGTLSRGTDFLQHCSAAVLKRMRFFHIPARGRTVENRGCVFTFRPGAGMYSPTGAHSDPTGAHGPANSVPSHAVGRRSRCFRRSIFRDERGTPQQCLPPGWKAAHPSREVG